MLFALVVIHELSKYEGVIQVVIANKGGPLAVIKLNCIKIEKASKYSVKNKSEWRQ